MAMAAPSLGGTLRTVPEISVDTVTIDFGCVTPLARTERRTALFSTVTADTFGIASISDTPLSASTGATASGSASDAGLLN